MQLTPPVRSRVDEEVLTFYYHQESLCKTQSPRVVTEGSVVLVPARGTRPVVRPKKAPALFSSPIRKLLTILEANTRNFTTPVTASLALRQYDCGSASPQPAQ